MARITVEDCIDKVEGPYDLVLIAKERAVQLNSGEQPNVDPENDKNTVIALKEIAESKISVDELKESAINKLRKHIEQEVEVSDQIEPEEDNFENIYKGEVSKSGVPILPSKRARKIPEKIEIFKEKLIQEKIFKNESLPENDKNTVIALKEIAENKVSVDELKESAINKLRKHVEQDIEVSDQIRPEEDDFENIYKGEISKSGVPILPSKRARKIPEKIDIFKEQQVEKKIFKDESLPENKEISSIELEDQEKIKKDSDELVDPKSSDNA